MKVGELVDYWYIKEDENYMVLCYTVCNLFELKVSEFLLDIKKWEVLPLGSRDWVKLNETQIIKTKEDIADVFMNKYNMVQPKTCISLKHFIK